MPITLNNPPGPAAVTAVADKIQDDVTVLGVTGTLAAADVTLEHFGKAVGESADLSGCNIGTVTLTDCFSDSTDAGAFASTLDLSHNRMDADAIEDLITAIHAAIVTGTSSAVLTLDISDNAAPNAATMALIYATCGIMSTGSVVCDTPAHIHGSANVITRAVVAQQYDYTSSLGGYVGVDNAAVSIFHDGSTWILRLLDHDWVGPAESITGNYVLAGHDTIVISV